MAALRFMAWFASVEAWLRGSAQAGGGGGAAEQQAALAPAG